MRLRDEDEDDSEAVNSRGMRARAWRAAYDAMCARGVVKGRDARVDKAFVSERRRTTTLDELN